MQYVLDDPRRYITTIEFRNTLPILNVERMHSFSEEGLVGTFSKKEFRYSFDNNIWQPWQTFNMGNINSIHFQDNENFYIHIKYTRSSVTSGNLNAIYLTFDSRKNSHSSPDASIIDADLLDGEHGSFYLNNENHYGPIASLGVFNVVDGSSIGVFDHREDVSSLGTNIYFKRIEGAGGIILSENAGIITIDASSVKGEPSIDGGAWITNINATGAGNVGNKVYTSNGYVLASCVSDTNLLTVNVLVMPGHGNYKPSVTVYGVPVTNLAIQGSGPQWTGSAAITFNPIDTSITVIHENGAYWSTIIQQDTPAVIQSATFTGGYPVGQTELKAGDTFNVNVQTDVPITSVVVDNFGAFTGGTYPVSGNNVIFTATIADRGTSVQSLGFRLRVVKSTGSTSANYLSSSQGSVDGVNLVKLNNLYPTVLINSITYPGAQQAIKVGDSATVSNTVTNFDIISYTSATGELTITNPTSYQASKSVSYFMGGYNIATNNFRITATRTANAAVTTANTVVWIANTPANLSVVNPSARLRSGGNDGTVAQQHTITINSTQRLLSPPNLVIGGGGTWLGGGFSWSAVATSFSRSLQVHDNDIKATYTWGVINGTNLAGISSSVNYGDTSYVLGGFVVRTLTLPAFGWQAIMNVAVSDYSKLSSSGSGQVLVWQVIQNTRSTLGDVTRPQADKWSASATFTNPTTINILDKSATDSQSQATTFNIQEGI